MNNRTSIPLQSLWITCLITAMFPTSRADAASPTPAVTGSDAPRAVILVDERLHAELGNLLEDYARAASQRRGFVIKVQAVHELDDMPWETVRKGVQVLHRKNPGLEGVLFVGNVRQPSFHSPRGDNLQTRYFPHAYEDVDLVVKRKLAPGVTYPGSSDPERKVPDHDLDSLEVKTPSRVELWAAFLPVGLTESTKNGYADWAQQLTPFLHKAIQYHTQRPAPAHRMYKVSNQLWNLASAWTFYGPDRIEFYATNPLEKGSIASGTPADGFCTLPPEQAYQRSPMEEFSTWDAFQTWYSQHEWMGEGWQKDAIFLGHMNSRNFDLAWVNVHSCENFSLISSDQARSIQQGALIMLLSGCGVGGYRQPDATSFVDSLVAPEQNILCAFVYGSSRTLAALGDPFNRGHESYYERMIEWLTQGNYLGQAHLKRMQLEHDNSHSGDELKENVMELLIGDPFVDLTP